MGRSHEQIGRQGWGQEDLKSVQENCIVQRAYELKAVKVARFYGNKSERSIIAELEGEVREASAANRTLVKQNRKLKNLTKRGLAEDISDADGHYEMIIREDVYEYKRLREELSDAYDKIRAMAADFHRAMDHERACRKDIVKTNRAVRESLDQIRKELWNSEIY